MFNMALRLSQRDERIFATKLVQLVTNQIESFQIAQYKVELEDNIHISDCNTIFPWKRTINIDTDHFINGLNNGHVSTECIVAIQNGIREYRDPKVLRDVKVILGYLCDWIFQSSPTFVKFNSHDMSIEFQCGIYHRIEIDNQPHEPKETLLGLVDTFLFMISSQYSSVSLPTEHLVPCILPQYSPAPLFIARCTGLPPYITFIICDYLGWEYLPHRTMKQIYDTNG
jgi:hypothetical protein